MKTSVPASDLRAVDVAVVVVGGPLPAHGGTAIVDRTTIEVADLKGVRGVGVIHDGDAALIPGLDLDIAAGDRNQRAVVRDAVFVEGLRRGHLVVRVELQLLVRGDGEDGVCTPAHGVARTTAWLAASAPLVGKEDSLAVVGEVRGMPECVVGIGDSVETLGVDGVLDVEQDAVARAGTAGYTKPSVDGDVVAATGSGGIPLARE